MKFKNYIETESGIKDTSTSPGTSGQLLSSTVAGTSWIDQSAIHSGSSEVVDIQVKNISSGDGGINLVKGDPVYIYGSVGASPRLYVDLADADSTAINNLGDNKMPCVGLLDQDLAPNGEGTATVVGKLRNLITSPIDSATPNENDTVYVKSGGGLTLTKPAGYTNLVQNVGQVGRVSTSNDGNIVVAALLRSNDIPNLPTGRLFVGTATNTSLVSDVVYVDDANDRVGISTTIPGSKLQVDGEIDANGGDGYRINGKPWATESASLLRLGNWDSEGFSTSIFDENSFEMLRVVDKSVIISSNVSKSTGYGTAANLLVGGDKFSPYGEGVLTLLNNEPNSAAGMKTGSVQFAIKDDAINGYASSSITGSINLPAGSGASGGGILDFNTSLGQTGSPIQTRMRINYNGNVGIGTTNPGYKLDVAGDMNVGVNTGFDTTRLNFHEGFSYIEASSIFGSGAISMNIGSGEIYLRSDGNVGIDTSNPSQKLHVSGNARVTGAYYDSNNDKGTSGQILSSTVTGTDWIDGSAIPGVPAGSGTVNYLARWTPDNDTLGIGVTYDNGTNVGIGTTSPQAKLHVANGTLRTWTPTTGTSAIFESTVNNRSFVTITGANEAELWFGNASIQTKGRVRYEMSTNNMEFWTNATQKMVINGSGNVGIGTTSPTSAKLVVAGDVDVWNSTNTLLRSSHNGSYGSFQTFTGGLYGILALNPGGGNVGIGTTSPSEKLVVRNGTSNTDVKILAYNSAAGTEATLKFSTISSETDYEKAAIIARNAAGSFGRNDMHFALDSAADSGNVQFSDTKMTILNGGNVGIGTTSPAKKLTVGNIGVGNTDGLKIEDPSNTAYGAHYSYNDGSTAVEIGGVVNNTLRDCISIARDATRTITINTSEFVGIGDTSPSYKLDVTGEGRFTGDLRCLSLIQTSERDHKKDIILVGKENSTIPIKEYKYKTGDNNKVRYGVIAEDIESTYPELVETDADGIKGVKYIDLLVRKIAELETEKKTLVNWRHYHSNTSYNTLYDTGMTTAFPYAYGSIPAPYDMYFTSVTLVNNPWSSYNKGPDGDTALFQAYVNGVLKYEVRDIRYGQNPYESITADFGQNVRLKKGESLKIRFYANGMWRYCNSTIILTEI